MTAPATHPSLAVTPTYEPGSRRCYSATSDNGEWGFRRARHRGTPWITYHLPTRWELSTTAGSLDRAARAASDPATYRDLLTEALFELTLIADPIPTAGATGITVTNHDWARGVLTWLADNHPDLVIADVIAGVVAGPMFIRPVAGLEDDRR
jgi:hypothetical protein